MVEVREFLAAVKTHWASLATGGFIVALVFLSEKILVLWKLLKDGFSPSLYMVVLGSFVFIACFLAWRDQFREAQSLKKRLTPQLTPVLETECRDCIFDHDDESFRRIGIANRGGISIENVAVYIDRLEPGPVARRQLPWTGTTPGASLTLAPSKIGHSHVDIMLRIRGKWYLPIGGLLDSDGFDPTKRYRATLSIEGHTAPVIFQLTINPTTGMLAILTD